MNIEYYRELAQKVTAQIKSYRFVHSPCPCGRSTGDIQVSEVDRYGLALDFFLCTACGTIRIDPYLDNVSVGHFYEKVYHDMYGLTADLERHFAKESSYAKNIISIYGSSLSKGSNVLEVGCGAGGGVAAFQQHGFNAFGWEYNPTLVSFGQKKNVKFLRAGHDSNCAAIDGDLTFALIYAHHVFEHVQDPLNALLRWKEKLAPNGCILLIVPDIVRLKWCDDLRRYFHIAHKYNYSFAGLKLLAAQAGMTATRAAPPELWVELRPVEGDTAAVMDVSTAADQAAAKRLLNSLKVNEMLYGIRLYCIVNFYRPLKQTLKRLLPGL